MTPEEESTFKEHKNEWKMISPKWWKTGNNQRTGRGNQKGLYLLGKSRQDAINTALADCKGLISV